MGLKRVIPNVSYVLIMLITLCVVHVCMHAHRPQNSHEVKRQLGGVSFLSLNQPVCKSWGLNSDSQA